jgi:hypothetical protein
MKCKSTSSVRDVTGGLITRSGGTTFVNYMSRYYTVVQWVVPGKGRKKLLSIAKTLCKGR